MVLEEQKKASIPLSVDNVAWKSFHTDPFRKYDQHSSQDVILSMRNTLGKLRQTHWSILEKIGEHSVLYVKCFTQVVPSRVPTIAGSSIQTHTKKNEHSILKTKIPQYSMTNSEHKHSPIHFCLFSKSTKSRIRMPQRYLTQLSIYIHQLPSITCQSFIIY